MAKKKTTIDDLAVMIKRGFDQTATKDEVDKFSNQVDKRFVRIEQRLDHVDARLSYIERDIADIRKHFVYRDEFEDALARIRLLEKKLGIQSGK